MFHRHLRSALAAAAVAFVAFPASAQWINHPAPGIPRTADGKPDLDAPAPRTPDNRPDLSGIWRTDPGGYEFNLVSELKNAEVLPWAYELYRHRLEDFGKDWPGYRCMPEIGPLYSFGLFKILQTPRTVAVLSEVGGAFRQILTDGRKLPENPNPTWMGYSVGHWEGDTLVVESAGFNDKSWLDAGHPHTDALRVVERYHRKDFGHLQVQMTFEDPKAYARPWTINLEGTLSPDTELLESVCNENEKDIQHFVVTEAERRKSRTVVKVSPEVLSKYVGTYVVTPPLGPPLTFVVSSEGDQLAVQRPGSGRYPLIAESDTTFSTAGTTIEFVRDAKGEVTYFVMPTFEGDQKGARQR